MTLKGSALIDSYNSVHTFAFYQAYAFSTVLLGFERMG